MHKNLIICRENFSQKHAHLVPDWISDLKITPQEIIEIK